MFTPRSGESGLGRATIDWESVPDGLDQIAVDLRALRSEAGSPSYREIVRRIAERRSRSGSNAPATARSTVYDCFRTGRSRIDLDVAMEIAAALGLPDSLLPAWADRVRAARTARDAATVVTGHRDAPPPIGSFVGREDILRRAEHALRSGPVWLSGLGGVGKTQIALRLAERSPHGGSLIDLRGYRAESVTVDAPSASRAILRLLGAPGQSADTVPAVIRSTERMLILDDAPDLSYVEQVIGDEPLPGVIVTSRGRITREAPAWCSIDVRGLSDDEVGTLLASLATLDVEEPAAQQAAQLTDGLPLAISLIAHRIRTHSDWTLSEHLGLIQERIAADRVEDDLAEVFAASYADLTERSGQLLRAFAVLPIAELGPEEAGVLLGVDGATAQQACDELVAHSLAILRGDSRIVLHALVRSFARDRAKSVDAPSRRDAAFVRLGWFFADRVWAAYDTLHRELEGKPPEEPPSFTIVARDWDRAEADSWLEEHLSAILQLAHASPGEQHPELLLRISEGLAWWLKTRGRYAESAALHAVAVDAAEEIDDKRAWLRATLSLCRALANIGGGEEARERANRAIEVAQRQDRPEPVVLGSLMMVRGLADVRTGRFADAITVLRRASDVLERSTDTGTLILALTTLGMALSGVGDFRGAYATSERALSLAYETGNAMLAVNIRANQVEMITDLGDYERALAVADEAAAAAEELDVPFYSVFALGSSAEAARRLRDFPDALRRIDRCVAVCRAVGHASTLAEALIVDAEISIDAHLPDRAGAAVSEAEDLLDVGGDPVLRGRIQLVRGDLAATATERAAWWQRARSTLESSRSRYLADAQERLARP